VVGKLKRAVELANDVASRDSRLVLMKGLRLDSLLPANTLENCWYGLVIQWHELTLRWHHKWLQRGRLFPETLSLQNFRVFACIPSLLN